MANEFHNFPPNLDDGELWLPSDIFLNEVPSKFKPSLQHHRHFSCMDDLGPRYKLPLSRMDDLAHRFAALSLPKRNNKLPLPASYETRRGPVRYGLMNSASCEVGQSLYAFRTGSSLGRTKPVYEFQLVKPTPAHVESTAEARARLLQRQQSRLVQNRGFPFQANGFSTDDNRTVLGGGLVRECGGTGVFHPRIVNTNVNANALDSKRRQCVRNRQPQEFQGSRQMNSMKRANVTVDKKPQECYYHLPPEMDLPRDWTY